MWPLPIDRVHVWTAPTEKAGSDAQVRYYATLVPADELSRAERFVHHDDRMRFLLARAMARAMLSRYVPVAPQDWRFRIEPYGRPELTEHPPGVPDLRFNVSHTKGLVACAVTVGREVGVDVEFIHRELTYQVPERFFSSQEVADLRALPRRQQPQVFFDYWTLKESYIKARGLGLALPLGQFTFLLPPGRAPVICFAPELHDDPESWQFAQFWPTRDHRMAVAVRRVGDDLPIDVTSQWPEAGA